MMPQPASFGRIEHLWILALAGGVILASFLLSPTTTGGLTLPLPMKGEGIRLPPTCASRLLLGVPCPGCGLTRSFVATARCDFDGAVRLNPMGPVLFVLCLLQIPYRIVEYVGIGGSNIWWNRIKSRFEFLTWAVLIGLVASWTVRMILGLLPPV